MSQNTQSLCNTTKLCIEKEIDRETSIDIEPCTPVSTPSPLDLGALPLGYLVPANRPALQAISETRRKGSEYHSKFIKEVAYRENPTMPCFELALGGLPDNVKWRIGRGRAGLENEGVDFLLIAEDNGIASVHASFGWTVQHPALLLMVSNDERLTCTINGRVFSYGHQIIPFENTILIGDCAFTLLFKVRTPAAEALFQAELRHYVLRLLQLGALEERSEIVAYDASPQRRLKRMRSGSSGDGRNTPESEEESGSCNRL